MSQIGSRLRSLVALVCCLTVVSGCIDPHGKSSGFVNAAGRRVEYSIDENADLQGLAEATIIKFGTHNVRVEKERLFLDGKESATIGAGVRKVEIVVVKESLKVLADGENIFTTQIAR